MDFMNQWTLLWIVTRTKRSSIVFYLCKVTRSSGFWIEQKKRFNLGGKGYIQLKTDVKAQAFHLLELVFFLIDTLLSLTLFPCKMITELRRNDYDIEFLILWTFLTKIVD